MEVGRGGVGMDVGMRKGENRGGDRDRGGVGMGTGMEMREMEGK